MEVVYVTDGISDDERLATNQRVQNSEKAPMLNLVKYNDEILAQI